MSLFGSIQGVVTGLVPYAVEKGIAFRAFDRLTIPPAGIVYWSAILPADKAIILYSRRIASSKPSLLYEVLAGSTGITYDTALAARNLNALSNKVSGANIRRVSAVATPGAVIDFDELVGAGGSGSNSVGGSISTEEIRILSPGIELLLRMTNNDANQANASIYLNWIEVPPESIQPN